MTEHLPAENEKLKSRLNDAIASNSVFHAYIFLSEHRDAAEVFAKGFIKGILTHRRMDQLEGSAGGGIPADGGSGSASEAQEECSGELTHRDRVIIAKVEEDKHEDVIVIRKKGASTRIEAIRDMQTKIVVRPIGERHIVLIVDGDEMGDEAQNALLKTLEEPPGDTILIILSGNIENLLPTVRSRSIVCTLEEESDEISEEITEAAAGVLDLASEGAGYYRIKKAAAPVGEGREDIGRFIDRAEELCRDRLSSRDDKGIPIDRNKTIEQIKALEEARNKLGRGMSPKYIIKELLLKIGG